MKINRDAEMAVVGSMLIDDKIIEDTLQYIDEADFYSPDIKNVFLAIKRLFNEGRYVDIVSVCSNDFVNRSLVSDCISSMTSSNNVKTYADIVKDAAKKNKILDFIEVQKVKIHDDSYNVSKILSEIERYSVEMSEDNKESEIISIEDTSMSVIEKIEERARNPKDTVGIPTGFKALDKKLNGLNNGDLIILAARPACGKSTFSMQVAKNVAIRQNVPTMIFSLEMPAEQITERMLCSESKVPLNNIKTGKLTDSELKALRFAHDKIHKAHLMFNDNPRITVSDIRTQLRLYNARNENKIGLIVLDYLQLMSMDTKNDNLAQAIGKISRELKVLALEFNIPVICLSQLSRDVEKRGGKPKLSDLRDSGSIEQDADIVMFLHKENRDEENQFNPDSTPIELIISKHRNGELGEIMYNFTGNKMMFAEDELMINAGFSNLSKGFTAADFE